MRSRLAIAMCGVEPSILVGSPSGEADGAASARGLIKWAAETGFSAIQLDAAWSGLRPRELDRSARRDLAAELGRLELAFNGLDLWIPPEHFADPSRADRAVAAVVGAIGLARDLARMTAASGRAVVSVTLPREGAESAVAAMGDAAAREGAVLADHSHPARASWPAGIALGVDPATVLLGGASPGKAAAAASPLAAARLSDADAAGRCAIGSPGSRLDLDAYAGAVAVAAMAGSVGRIATDLRGVRDQPRAAAEAMASWSLRALAGP